MRNRVGLLALLFILGQASAATAGLIVTIGANGTSNISASGISLVDVTIASDDAQNPVSLFGYTFNFKITAGLGVGNKLEFAVPVNASYFNDSNYVFFGNSGNYPTDNYPPEVDPNAGTGYGTFQRITGSDNTADFSDILVTTAPVLLTRLAVVSGSPAIQVGDTFKIDSFTYTPPLGGAGTTTIFSDGVTITPDVPTGVLTVVAPTSVVPEPGTLAIAATGLITLCVVRLARRGRRLA